MIVCCILTVLLTISCNIRSGNSQNFAGPVAVWETGVHDILPCGSLCVLTKFPEVYQAGKTCAEAMVNEIQNYIDTNLQGLSYSQIYERIIKAGAGGQSVVCGWFKTHSNCFKQQVSSLCGSRIQNSVQSFLENIEKYACSTDPPFSECLLDPMFIQNNAQVEACITNLLNVFTPYFPSNSDFINSWQNMYNDLILPPNGQLFTAVNNFGTCIGRQISGLSRSGCDSIGRLVETHISEFTDYVNHGNPGSKDHVKCFANPKLWPEIAACGTGLVNGFDRDPTFNPSINNPSSTQDVGGTVLLQLQSRNVQAFSPHYMKFSTCVKASILHACGRGSSSYEVVRRLLTPLDEYFFNQFDQSFSFPSCGSGSGSGGGSGGGSGNTNFAPKKCPAISDLLLLQLTSLMTGVWKLV